MVERPEQSIEEVLHRLKTRGAGTAWKDFLNRYSPLIMHIAAQYEYDGDQRQDCYLFICEKLSDNGFRRLLRYQPEGSASFRGWLGVVVANLCVDWKRHNHGRARPFKTIQALSQLDQLVFKFRFQQRLETNACLALLEPHFPGITQPQLANAVSRIHAALSQHQQWLLSAGQTETTPLDSLGAGEPTSTVPDPEQNARRSEQMDRLQDALTKLSPHHRLLIRLRYQQELSLKEIARLTRLGDPFRARRHIQAALQELAKLLESSQTARKSETHVRE